MISNGQGTVLGYSLFNLQERGKLMCAHGDEVYEGQVIGIHSRDNDLVVNPLKGKKLTNMRAAGKDENIVLTTPVRYTLEQAMEFIEDDELVEITPSSIRIRKRALKELDRKRAGRGVRGRVSLAYLSRLRERSAAGRVRARRRLMLTGPASTSPACGRGRRSRVRVLARRPGEGSASRAASSKSLPARPECSAATIVDPEAQHARTHAAASTSLRIAS